MKKRKERKRGGASRKLPAQTKKIFDRLIRAVLKAARRKKVYWVGPRKPLLRKALGMR